LKGVIHAGKRKVIQPDEKRKECEKGVGGIGLRPEEGRGAGKKRRKINAADVAKKGSKMEAPSKKPQGEEEGREVPRKKRQDNSSLTWPKRSAIR